MCFRLVLFEITITSSKKTIKKIFMKNYEKISYIIFNVLGIFSQKDLKKYYILGQNMLAVEDHGMLIKWYILNNIF